MATEITFRGKGERAFSVLVSAHTDTQKLAQKLWARFDGETYSVRFGDGDWSINSFEALKAYLKGKKEIEVLISSSQKTGTPTLCWWGKI